MPVGRSIEAYAAPKDKPDKPISKPAKLPKLSIGNPKVVEGDAGATTEARFTVKLSAPSAQPVTVTFATEDKSATAGSDYVGTSGTLTFNPGETSQTLPVPVMGDGLDEDSEHFFVLLSAATNARLAKRTGNAQIKDDDAQPALSIGDAAVTEGNAGVTVATFVVSLSSASGKLVTVDFTTTDGTASVAGGDYSPAGGTLTFEAGETSKTVAVSVNGDTEVEDAETFFVDLANEDGATLTDNQAVGTIATDD